jgi:hypothetical protein
VLRKWPKAKKSISETRPRQPGAGGDDTWAAGDCRADCNAPEHERLELISI